MLDKVRILKNTKYNVEWEVATKTVYIESPVKVRDLEQIEVMLLCSGYIYKNLIIEPKAKVRDANKYENGYI